MPFEWLCVSLALLSIAISITAALYAVGPPSSARRLRSVQSKLDTLSSDYAEVLDMVKRLDARDRMRAVRAGRTVESSPSQTQPGSPPNPNTDPVAWKAYMRTHHPAQGAR